MYNVFIKKIKESSQTSLLLYPINGMYVKFYCEN